VLDSRADARYYSAAIIPAARRLGKKGI
jgi:hypothetical protein